MSISLQVQFFFFFFPKKCYIFHGRYTIRTINISELGVGEVGGAAAAIDGVYTAVVHSQLM